MPSPHAAPLTDSSPLTTQELSSLATEQHRADRADIDLLPTPDLVRLMTRDDARVPEAVHAASDAIARAADVAAARLAEGGRLIYMGAGTAGRVGVLDASECVPTFNTRPGQVVGLIAGGPSAVTLPVEGAEDDGSTAVEHLDAIGLTERDVVCGIAASGRTPYAVAGVRHARALGAATIGVSCSPDSALGRAADIAIEVVVGPEFITGSTRLKAGTAQKLVVNALSTVTMIRLGKTYGNLMVDLQASNEKLRKRSHHIVSLATGADADEIDVALEASGHEVKTAVHMLLAGTTAEQARTALRTHDGSLRKALAEPTPAPVPR
ncbi:N-acetylmuramic acid 6-phosphate etherase [Streptomyces sp. bgisy091]|uniref:N-acetylmuramic acid 6-phosphate etherase n=1 Tax=Streptomyces sp. bgisy091 TaxID=3413778 RepID=UPI003D72F017